MPTLKKILYIEDDANIRAAVELVVQTLCDFEVRTCENGQGLLECAFEYDPDLILLDVIDSEEIPILKNIMQNEQIKNIPVIFIADELVERELNNLKELGVIGVIIKPFEPIELCDDIKKIWCKSLEDKTTDPLNCCREIENVWKCNSE